MKNHIQTFTVIAGNNACNATCPFCVSKMTGKLTCGDLNVNSRNLLIGCRYAVQHGSSTVLITSKGEATLYPDQITEIIQLTQPYFPIVELQTNGMNLMDADMEKHLHDWYELGLTTIAISCVDFNSFKNMRIYGKHYPFLNSLVKKLHSIGFSVRITCMLIKNFMDTTDKIVDFITWCFDNQVEQFTIRNIETSENSVDSEVNKWTKDNQLSKKQLSSIHRYLQKHGKAVQSLVHGGVVYDFNGQNVCFTNCLTDGGDDIRQLIYFPDGHIKYSWQYNGAILI